jgi:hypothetical protein
MKMRQPPMTHHEASEEDNDDYKGDELEVDMHDNNVGDVEVYYV